jgi:exopolyphosphatase / guanosine-5'-triphosphate,3'-diphosphate pyrophosphatase
MRVSAIDIGTNTVLHLIADVHVNGIIDVVRDEQVIARLGKDVDRQRMIPQEAFERMAVHLGDFLTIAEERRVERIVACGTSALRDAANSKDFLDAMKKRLGLTITILSGQREAELTYLGAVSEFLLEERSDHFAIVDLGGGSCELSIGVKSTIQSRRSIDIGSVRLTERFLHSSPPTLSELEETTRFVRHELRSLGDVPSHSLLIGVAGTLTTLASIDLQLRVYDRLRVSGHVLTQKRVQTIFNELARYNINELRKHPQIAEGRADIILAGILILKEFMELNRQESITVSDRGLRYGIALAAASPSFLR